METNWKAIREGLEEGTARVERSVDTLAEAVERLNLLLDGELTGTEGTQRDETKDTMLRV